MIGMGEANGQQHLRLCWAVNEKYLGQQYRGQNVYIKSPGVDWSSFYTQPAHYVRILIDFLSHLVDFWAPTPGPQHIYSVHLWSTHQGTSLCECCADAGAFLFLIMVVRQFQIPFPVVPYIWKASSIAGSNGRDGDAVFSIYSIPYTSA